MAVTVGWQPQCRFLFQAMVTADARGCDGCNDIVEGQRDPLSVEGRESC